MQFKIPKAPSETSARSTLIIIQCSKQARQEAADKELDLISYYKLTNEVNYLQNIQKLFT